MSLISEPIFWISGSFVRSLFLLFLLISLYFLTNSENLEERLSTVLRVDLVGIWKSLINANMSSGLLL